MQLSLNDRQICGMQERGLSTNGICAYKWLLNKRCIGKTIIVYYSQFRKWMAKNKQNGEPISKRHASRLIHSLGEKGFAEVKSLGGGAFEVTLFSLDFVFGQECRDETKLSSASKSQDQDPANTSPHKAQSARVKQQQLIQTKQLCTQAGIKYRLDKDWWEIASHGLEKIEATINLMKYRSLTTPITNIPGWFKQALRRNYYLDHDPNSFSVLNNVKQAYEYCVEKFNQWGLFPSRGELDLPKKTSAPKGFQALCDTQVS